MKKAGKKGGKWKNTLVQMLLGALLGFFLVVAAERLVGGIAGFALAFFALVVSYPLHILVHEGGHLIAGLLSGYRFVSFRVGSTMWIRQDDRIRRKKFSVPGTAGQCLLDPPKLRDGTCPVALYNLGGGLANLLTAALAAVIGYAVLSPQIKLILYIFALCGVLISAANLLPMKISGIANDGYNLLFFQKNPESALAFYRQMKINNYQSRGYRVKDIPEEFFSKEAEQHPEDPLQCGIAVMRMQRLEDEGRFEEAGLLGRNLLRCKELLPYYRLVIEAELLFMELIGPCRPGQVEVLFTEELKKFLKVSKHSLSTHRILCAYAVRFLHDLAAEEKARKDFERIAENYPFEGDIESEKEMMNRI